MLIISLGIELTPYILESSTMKTSSSGTREVGRPILLLMSGRLINPITFIFHFPYLHQLIQAADNIESNSNKHSIDC